MSRRDHQRRKVYRAESVAFGCRGQLLTDHRCWLDRDCEPPHITLLDGSREAAQDWVDRLSRSALYRRIAGWPTTNWAGSRPLVDRLLIDPDYQGTQCSFAGDSLIVHRGRYYPALFIALPHLRHPEVLLHEAIHVALPSRSWHGPRFAGAFIALTRDRFGEEVAERLAAALIDQGAEFDSDLALGQVGPARVSR